MAGMIRPGLRPSRPASKKLTSGWPGSRSRSAGAVGGQMPTQTGSSRRMPSWMNAAAGPSQSSLSRQISA